MVVKVIISIETKFAPSMPMILILLVILTSILIFIFIKIMMIIMTIIIIKKYENYYVNFQQKLSAEKLF